MAKIKFGAMMVDARGKLGGHVFSKNRGGAYIRTKVTPVNPQSTGQTGVRALFGVISQAWSGLTAAQRASFNGAVNTFQQTNIFGDIVTPSGKALFQRLNQNLGVVGLPVLTTAPSLVGAPSEVLEEMQVETAAGEINPIGLSTDPAVYVVIRSSGPVSQGTENVRNRMRIIGTYQGNQVDGIDVYSDYVPKFGAPALGQKIFFDVSYTLANGITTPRQKVLGKVV